MTQQQLNVVSVGRQAVSSTATGASSTVPSAVVQQVVDLERLLKTPLPVQLRIDLLQGLESHLATALGTLRQVVAQWSHAKAIRERLLALEQRLYDLMIRNLKHALVELDRSRRAYDDTASRDRGWLVRALFGYLGRQIEHSARWDRPWQPGAWQELHDTYAYLVRRSDLAMDAEEGAQNRRFDAAAEYKRLLLVGLMKDSVPPAERTDRLFRLLSRWAGETTLTEADSFSGSFGHLVVEISRDGPARKIAGAIDFGLNGWVLQPAPAFQEFVAGLAEPRF
jgi:hypothetical protein